MYADAAAFSDHDFMARARSAPRDMAIAIDKILVERGGLRAFIELAWHTVEGTGKYRSNWHIDAICEHLEAVSRGEIRRLAIAIPPRHMKSTSCAVMWPAWDWITTPERRFLYSSYAHNLAIRDSRKCRMVMNSPWFKARWGDKFRITSDQNTKIRFDNNMGGYRLSTSVKSQVTGEGGDFCIVDDPHNVREAESQKKREGTLEWWDEAMSSRLNDPQNGAFVIIQQRVHESDLLGHVLRQKSALSYTYLCLPAEFEPDHPNRWFRDPRTELGQLLWPARVRKQEIDEFKAVQGPYAYAGQYQQRPAPREGGLFKRSWFKVEKEAPDDCTWSRAWDLAATEKALIKSDPDYTATALVGFSQSMGKWYIKHVQRWRVSPHQWRIFMLELAKSDGKRIRVTIPKDPSQAGKDQSEDLVRMFAGYDVHAEPQGGDKTTRATPLMAQAGANHVVLIQGDWNEEFLTELTSFPTGAHDDMVDAVASAFNRLTDGISGLLDFYRSKVAEQAQQRTAVEREIALQGGMRVETQSDVSDLARAFLGAKFPKDPPK